MWIWVWLLPVLGVALHLGLVRYKLKDVQGDWSALLSGRASRKARELEEDLGLTSLMAEDTFAAAQAARQEQGAEAIRLLALACNVIQEAIPDRVARLKAMSRFARMVSAIVPLGPLLPREVRLRSVSRLAAVGRIVHHLLASTQERFRWFCLVLGWCYRATAADLGVSSSTAERAPTSAAAWTRFENGLSDFRTLDAKHVEALRALLASLATVQRPEELDPAS
jgi:hypothetical protein